MGIHGLTTFLHENKRVLSTTRVFSREKVAANPEAPLIPLVVDAWSFIYEVVNRSGLPWVYGGEYARLAEMTVSVVRAWIDVGLEPIFVLDGPYPELKTATLVSRMTASRIQPTLLFFRTSSESRSTPRFLSETSILPTFAGLAIIEALQKVAKVYFADTEADPEAVARAAKLGSVVAGRDSDFVILNINGYRGYAPLDEMVWSAVVSPSVTSDAEAQEEDEGGFQTVRKKKKKVARPTDTQFTVGIVPPESTDGLELSVAVYTPTALAKHLRIPATLLPLLGALLGNDFTRENSESNPSKNPRSVQSIMFERGSTPSQRVNRVTTVIRNSLPSSSSETVIDLIKRAVSSLLVRPDLHSGEIGAIVERIVESTLQYAIPRTGAGVGSRECECDLHDADSCPLIPHFSRLVNAEALSNDEEAKKRSATMRALYLKAYRRGTLSGRVVDALVTGTYWPRSFLEHPDIETVSRSVGRCLRIWMYAVLDDSLGLPVVQGVDDEREEDASDSDDVSSSEEEDSDQDEIISVEEETDDDAEVEDLLGPLKGALRNLRNSGNDNVLLGNTPASVLYARQNGPKSVTEYVRRGTRVIPEVISVPKLSSLLVSIDMLKSESDSPLALRSEEERFTVLLRILRSDISAVRAVDRKKLCTVLSLRWIVHTMHTRAVESGGSREREAERWTKREARAFLATLNAKVEQEETPPPLINRNIQLVAQVLMALGTIGELAQSLLLSEAVPLVVREFSGRTFHTSLNSDSADERGALWDAVESGLENAFAGEKKIRVKGDRDGPGMKTTLRKSSVPTSRFGLLADA